MLVSINVTISQCYVLMVVVADSFIYCRNPAQMHCITCIMHACQKKTHIWTISLFRIFWIQTKLCLNWIAFVLDFPWNISVAFDLSEIRVWIFFKIATTTESTTTTTESTTQSTTDSTTQSTTESTTQSTTESTTQSTTESTTQSTTESTTGTYCSQINN